jgi:hypothetical protein
MRVVGLILLNFYHQDSVENVYELIAEYEHFFKHPFSDDESDLRNATPSDMHFALQARVRRNGASPLVSIRQSPILAQSVVWPGWASEHSCGRPQLHDERARTETGHAPGFLMRLIR